MRRLLIIFTLCVGCVIVADAQSTFTERLQKSNSGEGKITVTHDQSIDELVNGKNAVPVQAAPKKQTETTKKQSETTTATTRQENARDEKNEQTTVLQETETTTATPDTIDTKKKVIAMTKKFAKASRRVGSPEYDMLQLVRRDYPSYRVETKTTKATKSTRSKTKKYRR